MKKKMKNIELRIEEKNSYCGGSRPVQGIKYR